MNSLLIAGLAILAFGLAFRFYSCKIERLWEINPSRKTPAVSRYNGLDYVPARHWTILFGHHFASIAGAAPIIGPVIALSLWGWAPALLWVILGTIFIGGVHDLSSLMVSVRREGVSIADVAESVVCRRAKIMFCSFVWLTLILIMAAFVYFCANTFIVEGRIVLPSIGLIPVAILMGFLLYNLRWNQILVTVLGLLLLSSLILLGNHFPISLGQNSLSIWSAILLVYCFFASITPVQVLLQPRDYLCSFILFFGIIIGFTGLIFSHPQLNTPFYLGWGTQGAGPLWPMLFVTIACGAISGFHSLIASGTTSKQLPSERYAKRIGYGGMVMEGLLAVLAILVVACGLTNQEVLLKFMSKEGAGPVAAFGQGFGGITRVILGGFGGLFAITMLNSFILTTLDTATRIGRYLTEELFGLKNRYLSTLIVVVFGGLLALSGRWDRIWLAFGAANQLVAGLALIVITMYLLSKNKPLRYTLIPAGVMLATNMAALIYQIIRYTKAKDFLLMSVAGILICLSVYMLSEVIRILYRRKVG